MKKSRRKKKRSKSMYTKRVKIFGAIALLLLLFSFPLFWYVIQQQTQQNTRAAALNFQPSPPYYATFFYPWYQTPGTDGLWSDWNDNGHTPTQNWFSNYLPDPNPSVFDPATELYSSSDDKIIYWQLSKMAEAKQTVAISSWWGINHKTDKAFRHIITDVMNRPDNPYPNLRWAIMYEKEGFGNPQVSELVNDLNYIKTNYGNEPGMLKINGKPVVFVYNAAHSGSNPMEDLSRWEQARAQTGFYVVFKVDPLNAGASPTTMDSWYEYAPAAAHFQQKGSYYAFVSPGFWLNGQAERLPRDATAFETGVKQMVSANTTWKLTETWNEWGEGTSVEPGDQVNQTTSGQATIKQGGYPFKNLYVDILNRNLPPIQLRNIGNAPINNVTLIPPVVQHDPVIAAAGDIACTASSAVTATVCQQKATSDLVLNTIKPDAALILGDDQYEAGKLSDYMGSYDPTWGRFKSISHPVIGNHQYGDPNVMGYFDYWNGVGVQTGKAGIRGQGYYSFDLGAWHIIALDSQCGQVPIPGAEQSGGRLIAEPNNCDKGAAQEQWLHTDLEAHKTAACTLAFWHEPYFTSGSRGSGLLGNGAQTLPLLQDLYAYHADLVLNGHQHWYERFAKQDPNGNADPTKGFREIIIGTGGKETLNLGNPPAFPNREARDTSSFGVIKLTLHSTSYDWQFVPVPGYTFTDSGSANCNAKAVTGPTPTTPPAATSTPTPTPVTPTFVCGGSNFCVPTVTPTPTVLVTIVPSPTLAGVTQSPSPTSVNPTGVTTFPTEIVPTQIPSVVPTQPSGGNPNPSSRQFITLMLQFIQLLLAILLRLFVPH